MTDDRTSSAEECARESFRLAVIGAFCARERTPEGESAMEWREFVLVPYSRSPQSRTFVAWARVTLSYIFPDPHSTTLAMRSIVSCHRATVGRWDEADIALWTRQEGVLRRYRGLFGSNLYDGKRSYIQWCEGEESGLPREPPPYVRF